MKTSVLALTFALAATAPAQQPDAIFYNGNILTGESLPSDTAPRVNALSVSKGSITATGTDDQILALKSAATELIDLRGGFVLPGLNDAHVHLAYGGALHHQVDLTGTASLAEMLDRVRVAAVKAPAGAWLTGGGWDDTLWPSKALPSIADLDPVTAGHPAIFTRIDGHIAVANSAAFTAAGITPATPDPQGGRFDHSDSGALTGILRESTAMNQVESHVPEPSAAERRERMAFALNDALCHGVTSVQDNSGWPDFLALESLESAHELPIRVSEWLAFTDPADTLKAHRAAHPATDPMLHTTMLKGFMDGSLGSRTAALNAPYADDPNNSGIPRYNQAELNLLATERAKAGFQLGFHAIGDRAVSMALDAFTEAINARQKRMASIRPGLEKQTQAHISVTDAPRYRIEHSQVVLPRDMERYRKLGVIASMQPNHLLTDLHWAESRLGPERAKYSYAWRSLLDHKVVLAFGTDYPVEPITPFRGVYSAITRMDEAQSATYHPEQKITLGEALYAYTQGSAYAEFSESRKGKLAPGQYADFVVLDRDLTAIPPHEILAARVLRTVVAGRTVPCTTIP